MDIYMSAHNDFQSTGQSITVRAVSLRQQHQKQADAKTSIT